MKRRQNDGRYPDDYAGYQNAGYDDGYDDGSGFQDDPFSETSAAANHRVKAQQAQDKRRKKKKVRIAIIVVVVMALLVGEFIVLMDHWGQPAEPQRRPERRQPRRRHYHRYRGTQEGLLYLPDRGQGPRGRPDGYGARRYARYGEQISEIRQHSA